MNIGYTLRLDRIVYIDDCKKEEKLQQEMYYHCEIEDDYLKLITKLDELRIHI